MQKFCKIEKKAIKKLSENCILWKITHNWKHNNVKKMHSINMCIEMCKDIKVFQDLNF